VHALGQPHSHSPGGAMLMMDYTHTLHTPPGDWQPSEREPRSAVSAAASYIIITYNNSSTMPSIYTVRHKIATLSHACFSFHGTISIKLHHAVRLNWLACYDIFAHLHMFSRYSGDWLLKKGRKSRVQRTVRVGLIDKARFNVPSNAL